MNTNTNPVRKSMIMLLAFLICFAAFATMACDGPAGCNGPDIVSDAQTCLQTINQVLPNDK